jgi:hypothetical protein
MTELPAAQRLIVVSDQKELALALAAAGVASSRPVVILIGGASKLDTLSGATVELAPYVRAVVATADAFGATLIDGGTDAGIMRSAGGAHRELKASVPLLGVAPIGRIAAPGVDGAAGATPLEPNHTHILLAPGTEWGDESPWLVEAARALSAGQPVVAVLIDGGHIAGVEATKCRAEGWPLIALGGSGRTADDLAKIARQAAGSQVRPADSTGIYATDVADGAPALAILLRALLERLPGSEPPPRIEYPALYVAASEASKRGRRLYRLLTIFELALVVGALLASTVVTLLPQAPALPPGIPPPPGDTGTGPESLAVLAIAGAFLAAFVLKFLGHSASYDDDWFIGRAIAETSKNASWRYMMKVPPYATDTADQRFANELSALVRRAGLIRQAVDRLPAHPQQISSAMRQVRALDLMRRRDLYISRRLIDQAGWYGRRSAGHRQAASRWFWVSVFLQLAASGMALLALLLTEVPIFLRVMSLLGALALAVTAWTQLNRDDELAKSYAATLQELLLIAETGAQVSTERELVAMVDEGEEAIGRENRTWVAKRADRVESPDLVVTD